MPSTKHCIPLRLRQDWQRLCAAAVPFPTRLATNRLRDRATRNNGGDRESEGETLEIMVRESAAMEATRAERRKVEAGWRAVVARLEAAIDEVFGEEGDLLTLPELWRQLDSADSEQDHARMLAVIGGYSEAHLREFRVRNRAQIEICERADRIVGRELTRREGQPIAARMPRRSTPTRTRRVG